MEGSPLNDSRITPNDVLHSIINLKQLVFEVTDNCNLQCKYCAYGELYSGYDKRVGQNLPIEKGFAIIDYLLRIWSCHKTALVLPVTYISFYGGEPLLNMAFIKEVVKRFESVQLQRKIIFSMTTNAMLLDKHMDYLVEKNFNLLISLDGNKEGNSYRTTKTGDSSFNKVISNIKLLQSKYQDYFLEHVNFNTVLHNRNSAESSYEFIKREFGKDPSLSELSASNIRNDKINEFKSIYQNKLESIEKANDVRQLENKLFMSAPNVSELLLYLHKYSGNFFIGYNDLLKNEGMIHFCPTGTCIPFAKKMFITVNGKILQCEKISHAFTLGEIDQQNVVKLDFNEIACNFNKTLDKVQNMCSACYRKKSCSQCMYFIKDINSQSGECQGFMSKEAFNKYVSRCMFTLYSNPYLYNKLLTEVVID